MEGYQRGSGWERGGKCTWNKQHTWQVKDRQREVKNSIGNVEAKELIWMTHGHELKRGECMWEEVLRVEWKKGEEVGQL